MKEKKTTITHKETKRDNSQLIKLLIDKNVFDSDILIAFGYFMSNQVDNLYNLGYYTSQAISFSKTLSILQKKHEIYLKTFSFYIKNIITTIPSNTTVEVFVDNIYIISNAEERKRESTLIIKDDSGWYLAIDIQCANRFSVKKISDKDIALKVMCNIIKGNKDIPNTNEELKIDAATSEITCEIGISKVKSEVVHDLVLEKILECITTLSGQQI